MNKLLNFSDNKYITLINKLKDLIKGSAFEGKVYIVGGAVRDAILDREIHDIDLVIDSKSGGVGFAVWLAYNTGCLVQGKNPCVFQTYGTAKLQLTEDPELSDINIECVQSRSKKYNPSKTDPSLYYGTIENDAFRRDLSINAIYYNITTDEILDPTGYGLSDIKNKTLRCPSKDICKLYEEDPIKIIRTIRKSVELGWGIEKNTWLSMVISSKFVSDEKQEKVTDEINKMMVLDNPSEAIKKLDACNILHRILPSLTVSKHVYQDLRPLRTLYEHVLETMDKTPKVLETRLAAMFHDIGKLKTYDKSFLYHSQIGADLTEEVMTAMKYSKATINTVKKAVENHEAFSSYFGGTIPRPAVIRGFVSKFDGNDKDLEVALDLIHANNITQMYGKKIKLVPGIKTKIAELDKKNESGKNLKIPISGKDIMAEYNLRPGPVIGTIMNKVKNMVIEDPNVTKDELLKFVGEYIKKVV